MPFSKPVTRDMFNVHRSGIKSVSKDKRVFSQTADRTNKFNVRVRPMRGGFRL